MNFANYTPAKPNITQCISTYSMFPRHVLIREHLSKLGMADVDDLLLRHKDDQDVDRFVVVMKTPLNYITLKLQRDDVKFTLVSCFLDIVV